MATTITTNGSTAGPGIYSNQRRMDRCRNGVRWFLASDNTQGRLEFHFSTNAGASWSEDTSQRITGVNIAAGASMRVKTTASGQERIGVVYRRDSDDKILVALGQFESSARTAFRWAVGSPQEAARGISGSSFHRRPDLEIHYDGERWICPTMWGQLKGDVATLWMGNTRFAYTGAFRAEAVNVHDRHNMSTYPRPSLSLRHLSDDDAVFDASPDLYVGWHQGVDIDPSDRGYMMRLPFGGTNWQTGQLRIVEENGVQSGLTASCYTGQRAAFVQVPSNMTDEILLHLMQPSDGSRDSLQVPSLGQGEVTSVSVTWDNYTADVWVLAAGTTNRRPHYIVYDWATRAFGSWVQINTDDVFQDTLTAKPGSRGSQIECSYAVISGSTSFKYQLVSATNVTPTAAAWVTESGAKDPASSLLADWVHNDADGDVQSQYTLRRSVNGAASEYWNGSSWQSSAVNISSAATQATVPWTGAGVGDVIEYTVRTADLQGFGPYSQPLSTIGSTPVNPTITAPAAGGFTDAAVTVTWTVAEQSAWRVQLLTTGDGNVAHDSKWQGDQSTRSYEIPELLNDGVSYTIELTTRNDQGLVSSVQSVAITVSLTPPPSPTVTLTSIAAQGVITVDVDNGTPGGGEAAADRNSVERRDDDDPALTETLVSDQGVSADGSMTDRTVASGRNYSYRATAYTEAGASTVGAWQT